MSNPYRYISESADSTTGCRPVLLAAIFILGLITSSVLCYVYSLGETLESYVRRADAELSWLDGLREKDPLLLERVQYGFDSQGHLHLTGAVSSQADRDVLRAAVRQRFGDERTVVGNAQCSSATEINQA